MVKSTVADRSREERERGELAGSAASELQGEEREASWHADHWTKTIHRWKGGTSSDTDEKRGVEPTRALQNACGAENGTTDGEQQLTTTVVDRFSWLDSQRGGAGVSPKRRTTARSPGLGKPPDFRGDEAEFAVSSRKTENLILSVNTELRGVDGTHIEEAFNNVIGEGKGAGLEAWRQLNRRYNLGTVGRSKGLIREIVSARKSTVENLRHKVVKLHERVRWSCDRRDHTATKLTLNVAIRMALLEALLPENLERHIQMKGNRCVDYATLGAKIVSGKETDGLAICFFNYPRASWLRIAVDTGAARTVFPDYCADGQKLKENKPLNLRTAKGETLSSSSGLDAGSV